MAMLNAERETNAPALIGAGGALITVMVWTAWLLATRYSVHTSLGAIDLSLLRYGIPALVLAPVWLRTGLLPKGKPKLPLVLMVIGSGAPFFQIAAYGLHATPASAAGVLLPGTMPLATALIGMAVLGERPDATRKLGMLAIFLGGLILLLAGAATGTLGWRSYVVLPIGATCWAIYTHAFRHSGLSASEGGALICVWSTIINLVLAALFGTHLFDASIAEITPQIISQGILSGLVATLAYGTAIRILGSTRAAAFTALTPVSAALGGALILGEDLGVAGIAATIVTGLGVMLSTGILSRR
jgi:drug/metabolite transporter (DMT)-like permease